MNDVMCVSGVEVLADYLEGLLPDDSRASLERHVVGCERCQAFLASYQATPEILRDATDVVLPEDLRRSIGEWMREGGESSAADDGWPDTMQDRPGTSTRFGVTSVGR
jgi:hypothetical protein